MEVGGEEEWMNVWSEESGGGRRRGRNGEKFMETRMELWKEKVS